MKKPRTLFDKLLNIAIAGVFLAGVVLLARQYILPPDPNFALPSQQPITITPAPPTPTAPPAAIAPDVTPVVAPAPTPTPAPTPRLEVPTEIFFDERKQSAPIIPVGIEEGNIIGSPDNAEEAGWFYYSAAPGNPSQSIVDGHRSIGGKAGIFSVVGNMKQGERVTIAFESGLLRYFAVDRVEQYKAEDVPQEYLRTGSETPTRLILITCVGDYGSDGFSKSRYVAICNELLELRREDDPYIE